MGPTLEVLAPADIALTGADMGMTINQAPVRGWRTARVNPGDVVRIEETRPLSKLKRWKLKDIVRKTALVPEAATEVAGV